jgi:hypothetical protein
MHLEAVSRRFWNRSSGPGRDAFPDPADRGCDGRAGVCQGLRLPRPAHDPERCCPRRGARGGGFEPPSSFEHWMFAPSSEEDSNPAPCRAGPSPHRSCIMPSRFLNLCWSVRAELARRTATEEHDGAVTRLGRAVDKHSPQGASVETRRRAPPPALDRRRRWRPRAIQDRSGRAKRRRRTKG